MRYSKTLLDERGIEHPRKNKYILDLIEAYVRKEKYLTPRDKHPYIIKLKKYQTEKKEVIKKAKEEALNESRDKFENKKLENLYRRALEAQKKVDFYLANEDLTYDAVLEYKICNFERTQIPKIIENEENLSKLLKEKSEELEKISDSDIKEIKVEIDKKKELRKKAYEKSLEDLEKSHKEKHISDKAYKDEKKIKKLSYEEDLKSIDFLNPRLSLKDEIENIKHRLKVETKQEMKVLESYISEARRRTPIEVEKSRAKNCWYGLLLPGLGQLLNGQKAKALIFFLGTLFSYFLAIPYALGFGNYQGDGIRGLISLAEGGLKLDRSMMFMIEGILALLLLFFAFLIFFLAFKDAKNVENRQINGIRPNTYFESKKVLATDGFPFLITSPALIIIIFIVLVPIFTTILISFTNMDPQHQNKFNWIGLSNYLTIAKGEGIAGKAFWHILGWTLIWTLGASTLAIFLGFVFALMVNNQRVKAKKVFRTVYLLPWAIPAFITIMFFSIMMSKNGLIANSLSMIFGHGIDIKNNPSQTRIALILLQGWLGHSYIFLLTTGVLQAIPNDLYEAASIDGATGFQQTIRITIPLVLFQIAPMLINQYTFNFNNFSIIYLFNQGGPFNPTVYGNLAGTSDILISYIYKLTMENQYQAIGAAITVFISIILIIISFIGYRNTNAFKEY
ncbi:MAG: ABC transporter permease subunit [Peptoniphilaceae bacterium]|nr:ABC transporter permease subunit [Peptoniphilaceae bacterium]MDY6018333.1 ABC transporter permease subunit [Anaerococcus sp.]